MSDDYTLARCAACGHRHRIVNLDRRHDDLFADALEAIDEYGLLVYQDVDRPAGVMTHKEKLDAACEMLSVANCILGETIGWDWAPWTLGRLASILQDRRDPQGVRS